MLNCNCELDGCYVMLNVELDAIVSWMLSVMYILMYILNVEDLLLVSCDACISFNLCAVWQKS